MFFSLFFLILIPAAAAARPKKNSISNINQQKGEPIICGACGEGGRQEAAAAAAAAALAVECELCVQAAVLKGALAMHDAQSGFR